MVVKATLKFRGDLRWALESKLMHKLGFRVKQRAGREWIIVEKVSTTWKAEDLENGELPELVQQELISRCNTIVNHFNDPECHTKVIRIRLNNIAMTLPPFQRKFVHQWMDRNCVEDQ